MAGSTKVAFGLRAMHSLSGVVPVGAFMLLQVWAHAKVLEGPEAHRIAVAAVHPTGWVARILIGVPLVYHVVYGLVLTRRSRLNVSRYPLSRNWTYTLQRVTGIIALLYIGLALALAWGIPADMLAQHMIGTLSQTHHGLPLLALAYLVGLCAAVFHLVVGLWMIGVRYGLASTRSSQTQSGMALAVIGMALIGWSGHTIVFLATGSGAAEPAPIDATTICDPSVFDRAAAAPSSLPKDDSP